MILMTNFVKDYLVECCSIDVVEYDYNKEENDIDGIYTIHLYIDDHNVEYFFEYVRNMIEDKQITEDEAKEYLLEFAKIIDGEYHRDYLYIDFVFIDEINEDTYIDEFVDFKIIIDKR